MNFVDLTLVFSSHSLSCHSSTFTRTMSHWLFNYLLSDLTNLSLSPLPLFYPWLHTSGCEPNNSGSVSMAPKRNNIHSGTPVDGHGTNLQGDQRGEHTWWSRKRGGGGTMDERYQCDVDKQKLGAVYSSCDHRIWGDVLTTTLGQLKMHELCQTMNNPNLELRNRSSI